MSEIGTTDCPTGYEDHCDSDACLIEQDSTQLALYISLPLVLGFPFMILTSKIFDILTKRGMKYSRAKGLFMQSFNLIVMFGLISYGVSAYVNPCISFNVWFNGLEVTPLTIFVSMGGNIIFGFIDNAGLFFGGCYLDEVFSLLPGSSDANVVAGYGNTFSDFLGAFLGTFVGIILTDVSGAGEGPLWAQTLGVVVGCLIGIVIPKLIMGNSSTSGLNKISARQVFLGSMGTDELEAIINGKTSLFDFRCKRIFKKLDEDNSNTLEYDEIKNYLKEAMGDDFTEEQFEKDLQNIFSITSGDIHKKFSYAEFEKIFERMAQEMLDHKIQLKKQAEDEEKGIKTNQVAAEN